MSSWSLVSTVNEAPEVLRTFVNHHLSIGCQELHLYFDNPADPAKKLFTGNPKVVIRDSTQDADCHERKQSANARDAYKHCQSEWLIHLDADELVYSTVGVCKVLSDLPPNVRQLNLLPWEAVFRDMESASKPFATDVFRTALRPVVDAGKLQEQYYPEAGDSLRRGLSGHSAGKSFIRKTADDVRGGIHFWKNARPAGEIPVHRVKHRIRLLHFDALSFPHWKAKLIRRVEGGVVMNGMDLHRLKQLEAFKEALASGREQALEELFVRLYVIGPERREGLRHLGLFKRFNWKRPDPDKAGDLLATSRRGLFGKLPFLKKSSHQPPPAARQPDKPEDARPGKRAQSAGNPPEAVVKARELLEDGNTEEAWATIQEAMTPAFLSTLRYPVTVEVQQLASWILIRRGSCGEAHGELSKIGKLLAGDFRKKVIATPGYRDRRMVFICGLHRSGTTMVEQWLQARYACATLRAKVPENEGQFLQSVYCDERPFGGPGKFAFSQQMHGVPPYPESVARDQESRIRKEWERWVHGSEDVLLEKSPPNITRIAYLRAVFPGARFIVWTRDPRAVSLATLKWSKTSFQELMLHWHTAYSAALSQLGDDCLVVRYEDFCKDSDGEIARIAEFAGLSPRPEPLPLGDRFIQVRNTNENYLKAAPKCEINIPFLSWKSFGYDFQ